MSVRAKAMVFEDPRSRELLKRIERVARSDAPVLITGETGTGKELVARQLHTQSYRAQAPFLAINAGAFSEQLIESELFGHEKGAFTGAATARAGWFETANGGTLFLDEIGDLPLPLQVKLLRVLQEGEVTRVGSRRAIKVDVRLIAATNVDLYAAMRAKHFREDLYFRLNVTSVRLPPLRERAGDILPLAEYFLRLFGPRFEQPGVRLDASATAALLRHSWPGNIRELENSIHHALLVCDGSEISAQHLELGTGSVSPNSEREQAPAAPTLERLDDVLTELVEARVPNLQRRVDEALLRAAYRVSGGNQLETARRLDVSRNVVRARLIEQGELAGPLRRRRREPELVERPAHAAKAGVRIGYQKLGLMTLIKGIGDFDRALAERGATSCWLEYPGGSQIVDALREGRLDLGVIGDCPAVFAQAEDVPIVYLAAEPPAPQSAALIVKADSKIATAADLRGKTVAVNRAAQAHYLLVKALEEAAIDPSEVDILFAPPERALKAFDAGLVEAWAIWDPWLASARLELGARVIRDATGLGNNSICYVARREFAEEHHDVVVHFVSELKSAALMARRDPRLAARLMAPELGLPEPALEASLARDLGDLAVNDELFQAQQDIADTLHRLRLIPRPVVVSEASFRLPLAG